jgi:hypothetical protein
MSSTEYKNRYNDVFTFTEDVNGDVLWEGNFEWCRSGCPNVYGDAYRAYIEDNSPYGVMEFETFKEAVHKYQYGDDFSSGKYTMEDRKYAELVYSDMNTINMIDPSGGPYLSEGYNLGGFGDKLKGKIIDRFESIETGYKIIIKK